MSISWQDFIARLQSANDLSELPRPTIDNEDAYTSALDTLSPTKQLLGASFIKATARWNEPALACVKEGLALPESIAWIVRALGQGDFDSRPWFEALAEDNVRQIIVQWGRDDLQSCLSGCDKHFLPAARIPVLTAVLEILLSITYEPDTPGPQTAMYALACHPFLDTIITSLMLDTANRLFPLGLRTILTVIPYAPQIVTTKVPSIMVILGRAVCWRDRPFVDSGKSSDSPATYTPKPSSQWAVALSADEQVTDSPVSLQPASIVRLWLVAIYGAWPSNLLAFVRDPILYLRGKQVECPYQGDWDDVWAPGLLAARTGPLLRDFSLHPSIMYFNSDGELRDSKRWEKVDPPEHVSRAHIIAHSEQLSRGRADFFDVGEQVQAHVVQEAAPLDEPAPDTIVSAETGRLQRENVLLRLEAGYADRLRKQYLFQLGRLHKNSLQFSVDEAEVHSFANQIKELRSTIDALHSELNQQRRDSLQAQQKHTKWQEQLREKLSGFRDEKWHWQNEAASIRTDRSNLETSVLRQQAELAQVKNERFKLQNQLAEVLPKVRHIEDYEIRMKQLVDAQKLWDSDNENFKSQLRQAKEWEGRVYQLEQLLRSVRKEVNLPEPAPPQKVPTTKVEQTRQPDMDHYISIAEKAQLRSERLEREALELRVELARVKGEQAPAGDRNVLWGE